jgi:uncharacterized protein (TIGR00369 family)
MKLALPRMDNLGRNVIREAWDRLHALPGGKRVFSRLLGMAAPYSGSIGASVEEVRPGHARVSLADRRAVRQHLGSVHAVALVNLAELCGNLAVAYSLPDGVRFIVAGLSIDYLKKARGTITATTDVEVPGGTERREIEVPVVLRDPGGTEVARARLRTLLGPIAQVKI